jgi:T4 bacteriophage base plate protein
MHALTISDILRVWEAGRDRYPAERALLLLALACPTTPIDSLRGLTVGQRNARLLMLRQITLGSLAQCFVKCPRCGEALEFTIDIEALRQPEPTTLQYALSLDDFNVSFRLPNSLDLAAVAGCANVEAGRRFLLERCLEQVQQNNRLVTVAALPEQVMLAVATSMVEHDPQAEMRLALQCHTCQHSWATIFDIVSFFWTEIEAQAKRLLREVHTLARAYSWREADILALSSARRQCYLELIG